MRHPSVGRQTRGARPAGRYPSVTCLAVALEEQDEGDDGFRAPLPPADRVWRHPAEIAAEATSADRALRRRRRRQRAVFFTASALTGAGVVVLALAAIGEFSDDDRSIVAVATSMPSTRAVSPGIPGVPTFVDEEQAEATMAAVTRIRASGPDGGDATGVFLPEDGYLLTTATAVRDASTVTVWLDNGVEIEGVVLGRDERNDVAVVGVDGRRLPRAVLGSARTLRPGDPALLVDASHRDGAGARLTVSSVVATDRRIDLDDHTMHGMVQIEQLDANAEMSGVLLASDGSVIGLMTGVEHGGYVTTIDWAMRIAEDLMADGAVHHAWLGVEGTDLRPEDADHYEATRGALVVGVGGPAAEAGLEPHDVIVAVDDEKVRSMSDLVVAVRPHRPGDRITLRYLRQGDERTCEAVLAQPDATPTTLVAAVG